jgi:hypothetical protein
MGEQMDRNRGAGVRGAVAAGAIVVGLAAMSLGAGASATVVRAASKPTAPTGYHVVTLKQGGFRIAVPDTWLALNPKAKSFSSTLNEVAVANPKLAPTLKQFSTLAASSLFMAADQTDPSFAANLVVLPVAIDKSELSNPSDVNSALKASLQGQVADLETRKAKVAGARAVVSSATLTAKRPDGTPFTAYLTIYLVSGKGDVIDFTFTSASAGQTDATVQTMIHSVKFAH